MEQAHPRQKNVARNQIKDGVAAVPSQSLAAVAARARRIAEHEMMLGAADAVRKRSKETAAAVPSLSLVVRVRRTAEHKMGLGAADAARKRSKKGVVAAVPSPSRRVVAAGARHAANAARKRSKEGMAAAVPSPSRRVVGAGARHAANAARKRSKEGVTAAVPSPSLGVVAAARVRRAAGHSTPTATVGMVTATAGTVTVMTGMETVVGGVVRRAQHSRKSDCTVACPKHLARPRLLRMK